MKPVLRPIPGSQWLGLGTLLGFGALWDVLRNPFCGDASWFLTAARTLLAGGHLYRDVIDMNTPLVYAVHLPAAAIATVTGIRDTWVFAVLLAGLASFCAWLLSKVLNDFGDRDGARLTVFAFVSIALAVPVTDYGQREHIFFCLFVPFMALALRRAGTPQLNGAVGFVPPKHLALAVGLAAGVGLGLKPHFAAALLPVAWVLWRARGRRGLATPEMAVLAAVQVAQLLWIGLVTPEYLGILQYTARLYNAFNVSWAELLGHRDSVAAIGLALPLLFYRAGGPYGRFARLLAQSAALAWLSAVLQRKGFSYHYFPALGLALLAALTAGVDWAAKSGETRQPIRFRRISAAWVFGCVLWVAVVLVARSDETPLAALAGREARGKPVMVLSSHLLAAFPLVNESGVRWTLPYNCLWMLPGFYGGPHGPSAIAYRAPESMEPVERSLFEAVIGEFERSEPALLIVDAGTSKFGFGGRQFDYIEYFGRDPRFRECLHHYARAGTFGRYIVMRHEPNR